MSKFFTRPHALLLACFLPALAYGEVSSQTTLTPGIETLDAPASVELPRPVSSSRFAALGKKSPFTLASTTEESADFAKDLILAGYFRTDGQDFVLVANRTQPTRLMVGTQASPAAQGLVLVKVERDPSGDPTKLRAQIRKGSETAMLKYESSSAPAGQPAPGQAAIGQPPIPGQAAPGQPVAGQGAPAVPGQKSAQNPPLIRRRVMPIPAAPAR